MKSKKKEKREARLLRGQTLKKQKKKRASHTDTILFGLSSCLLVHGVLKQISVPAIQILIVFFIKPKD
jgi:hypothetical protein